MRHHRSTPLRIIELRRHTLSLMAPMTLTSITGGVTLALVPYVANVCIAAGALIIVTLVSALVLISWRVFRISVRRDRIIVRELYWGGLRTTIHPLSTCDVVELRQSLLGRACDFGALEIEQRGVRVCYRQLTPYSEIDAHWR